MDQLPPDLGEDTVLTELRREASRRGHFALVISRDDAALYLNMLAVFLLGWYFGLIGKR